MSEHITREDATACVQNVARELGYAVAVHGSRVRDLDLLAVPWTEDAEAPEELVESIARALPGDTHVQGEAKPHGRVSYSIVPHARIGIDGWYIDLSIMPRAGADTEGADG